MNVDNKTKQLETNERDIVQEKKDIFEVLESITSNISESADVNGELIKKAMVEIELLRNEIVTNSDKEKTILNLSGLVKTMQENFVLESKLSVLKDTIYLRENINATMREFQRLVDVQISKERILFELDIISEKSLKEIIESNNIEICRTENQYFDGKIQTIVSKILTKNRNEHGEIVERLSNLYKIGDRIILKEKVAIKFFIEGEKQL